MKKLCLSVLCFLFLSSGICAANETNSNSDSAKERVTMAQTANITWTPVILAVGGTKIRVRLNDSITAQDILSQLPYTLTFQRYEMDYCGIVGKPLQFDEKDKHNGWVNGDISYDGTYLSLLFDGEEKSQSYSGMITIGRIDDDLSVIKGLGRNIELTITKAE